jgi:hypothetical protein
VTNPVVSNSSRSASMRSDGMGDVSMAIMQCATAPLTVDLPPVSACQSIASQPNRGITYVERGQV